VRVDKIYTLAQAIVVKTFGRINEEVLDKIRKEMQALTAKKSKIVVQRPHFED
jgi:hypothetical protein